MEKAAEVEVDLAPLGGVDQHLTVVVNRLLDAAQPLHRDGEIVQRLGEVRLHLDRLVERRGGLFMAVLLLEDDADSVVGAGHPGVDPERVIEPFARLGEFSHLMVGQAQVHRGDGEVAVDFQRALKARDRLLHHRLGHVNMPEVVMGVDEVGVEGDRLVERIARFFVARQAGQCEAAVVVNLGGVFAQRDGVVEVDDGVVILAARVMDVADVELGLGVVGVQFEASLQQREPFVVLAQLRQQPTRVADRRHIFGLELHRAAILGEGVLGSLRLLEHSPEVVVGLRPFGLEGDGRPVV